VEGFDMPTELKYDITNSCGVLSKSNRGWTKELNLICWNGREERLDLREWSPDHSRMGKGITLSKEEGKALRDILNKLDL